MDISIKWIKPTMLGDGKKDRRIYTCDLEKIPDAPGIYVFCRKHGDNIEALYVGQAGNIRKRIEQQLNSVELMMGLKQSELGSRLILVGVLETKSGQQQDKVLNIVEDAYIRHALGLGHALLNRNGTKPIPVHKIEGNGSRDYRGPFLPKMVVEE